MIAIGIVLFLTGFFGLKLSSMHDRRHVFWYDRVLSIAMAAGGLVFVIGLVVFAWENLP